MELSQVTELSADGELKLKWILKNPQEGVETLRPSPQLVAGPSQKLIEVGPRFNFSTPDSTNSVSICHSAQLTMIKRIEVSVRYLISFDDQQGHLCDEVRLQRSFEAFPNPFLASGGSPRSPQR